MLLAGNFHTSRGFRGAADLDSDAHGGDGKRFVVCADEKLSAFLEFERVTRDDRD
jgi:hypothetical protein